MVVVCYKVYFIKLQDPMLTAFRNWCYQDSKFDIIDFQKSILSAFRNRRYKLLEIGIPNFIFGYRL